MKIKIVKEENTVKEILKESIIKFIIYIPFILMWCIVLCCLPIINVEGSLSIYEDAFGVWIKYASIIYMILSITSILYLRLFIKKELVIQAVAYLMSIVFIFSGYILLIKGEEKFKDFTTEKWIEYPRRRLTMYFNLVEDYKLIGCTYEEIEELLGTPDAVVDNEYIYNDRSDNFITIYFKNGKVFNYDYVE